MVPFDDRLPTDSTNGDLAICDWTPLPFYPPSASAERRDATLRRWPPPVAPDQTIVDLDGDVGAPTPAADEPGEDLRAAPPVAGERSPLLIQSGAAFRAPALALPVAGDGASGPLLIQSGATFQAPDLEPGWYELEKREDQSPLLIKSGATFPAPDLGPDGENAVSDIEALAAFTEPHPVWRWSLNAVVVLVPVAVVVGLILATDPPSSRAAPDTKPKYATAVHGSLFPVEQAALAAVAAAKPSAPPPQSVPTAGAKEATENKGTASRRTGPDSRQGLRLLSSAQRSARERRWGRARSRAAAALKIMPRNRRASAIQRLAEQKLRQRRRHLADARKALKRGQWARARAHAKAALRVDPRSRRAKKIKQLAERRLRRRSKG